MPRQTLALLIPLVAIQLALVVIALRDLAKRRKQQVVGGNKWVWGAVILFGEILGPIVYLTVGRKEG